MLNEKGHIKEFSVIQLGILILTGVLSTYLPAIVSIGWLLIILVTFYGFASKDISLIWYGVAASPAIEIWSRISRAPFVPHELGKYYLVLVILILLYYHAKNNSNKPVYYVGSIMLLCLLPGVIVSLSYFDYEDWVLNGLGVIELSVLLIFMARERWTVGQFAAVLRCALIPIVPVLIYLTLKTPDFEKINFILGSNFKTSGDFGGNQVSTILGLGIIVVLILQQIKHPFLKIPWLNYLLIAALLYRGFLTFSRGGMMAAFVSAIVLFLPIIFSSVKSFVRFTLVLTLLVGITTFLFNKVNELTHNQLLLRYMGETPGTLSGTKEKNINTLTSYRLELGRTDLMMFRDNWLWGIGIGRAKDVRPQYGFHPIVSHSEYTRLMGEQGLGGLLVVLVLSVFPIWWMRKQKYSIWKAVCAALFTTAILTSFHSSMRTNTTVVCYVLAAAPVLYIAKKHNAEA